MLVAVKTATDFAHVAFSKSEDGHYQTVICRDDSNTQSTSILITLHTEL